MKNKKVMKREIIEVFLALFIFAATFFILTNGLRGNSITGAVTGLQLAVEPTVENEAKLRITNLEIMAAPVASNVLLNSSNNTNKTNEDLILYFTAADTDGDNIKNTTIWTLNGSLIAALNMPFERVNGTDSNNAWDYSGNQNTGTEQNGVLWNATGGHDGFGAYEFNNYGGNEFISVSASTGTVPFTLCAWLKPANAADNIALGGGGASNSFTYIYISASSKFGVYMYHNDTTQSVCSGSTTVTANNWYHVCLTNTGKVGANRRLYVNGGDDTDSCTGINLTSPLASNSVP